MQQIIHTSRERTLPSVLEKRLPTRILEAVRSIAAERIEEIRMHEGRFLSVSCGGHNYLSKLVLLSGEAESILTALCNGSRYAYHECINQGYLPLEGGVRVGVVGTAALEGNRVIGVSEVRGLILRIPHRIPIDVSQLLPLLARGNPGGMLIYAPPGGGKTSLLRSLAEAMAGGSDPRRTVLIDARGELTGTVPGRHLLLDILVGYPKHIGIGIAVRSLGAELLLCDEIGGAEDAHAVLTALGCGVPIVATVHAGSPEELLCRPHLRRLCDSGVFSSYVGLQRTVHGLSFHIHHAIEFSHIPR